MATIGKIVALILFTLGDTIVIEETIPNETSSSSNTKFIVGGLIIIAAVVYLIVSSTQANAQYFLTIDELIAKGDNILGQDLRISGAVIGDTIEYDHQTLDLAFTIAHIPGDNDEIAEMGGLASVLYEAVTDPNSSRLAVVYNGPRPDLLRAEAQAIITGQMGDDGIFYADELLLKCPTKYDEVVPDQVEG